MRSIRLCLLALGAFLSAWLLAPRASAQSTTTVFVDFNTTNSDPCFGPLLCAGNNWTWPDDPTTWGGGVRTFADPLPLSAQVVQVDVTVFGECTMRITPVSVNGNALGNVQYFAGDCACDNDPVCEASNVVTGTYNPDMPGYVHGGNNTVTLGPGDPYFVVTHVAITLHYFVGACQGGMPNGIVQTGEDCDTGGESATCDDDCTFPACRPLRDMRPRLHAGRLRRQHAQSARGRALRRRWRVDDLRRRLHGPDLW
jgi:hypothetical protein